jgi:hypothetical protein
MKIFCGLPVVVTLVFAVAALAGKPTPTPTPTPTPPPPGKIIYYANINSLMTFFSINSDGSAKTPYPTNVNGVPSRQLHGNHRWFLEARPLPGQTYFDGRQRYELFAVRDDANKSFTVQLTNDISLELAIYEAFAIGIFPGAIWAPGDVHVSWVATRVVQTTGEAVESGIYSAAIVFDPNNNVIGLTSMPIDPVVPIALVVRTPGERPVPDIVPAQFDWAPDMARAVYENTNPEGHAVFVYTINPASLQQIALGEHPSWSPKNTRIALNNSSGVVTVNPDGSDPLVISDNGDTKKNRGGYPTWGIGCYDPFFSPTGDFVVYRRIEPKDRRYPTINLMFQIYRCTETGGNQTDLTTDDTNNYNYQLMGWSQ